MTRKNKAPAAAQLQLTGDSHLEKQLIAAAAEHVSAVEDDARAVHRAAARLMRSEGIAEAGALLDLFGEYNAQYFGGELAEPLVLILTPSSARAYGDYCAKDVHGLQSRIRIAPKVMLSPLAAADVLLHEMIHAWQSEVDGDLEKGYRGHGPRFAEKCNEIGALLGLPPVSARGRGKKREGIESFPDCAQWPMNVRPEGYYGDALLTKRAKQAQEREEGESDREQDEPKENAHAAAVAMLRELQDDLADNGAADELLRALQLATEALHMAGCQ